MPSNMRVRGSDVQVRWTEDGTEVEGCDNVNGLTSTILITMSRDKFLGKSGSSVAELLDGAEGSITLQWGTKQALDFVKAIVARANQETSTVFNMMANIALPDGASMAFLWPDVAFGNIPINWASKDAFGEITFNWGCGGAPEFVDT